MRFLIIIICLLSERFLPHSLQKTRRNWVERYIELLKKMIPEEMVNRSTVTLYAATLLSLGIACLLMTAVKSISVLFIFNFAFELAVFYLCLGEHNLFYMNSNSNEHLTIPDYIYAINQEVMAVMFWFFMFGPFGAILYRVTLEFAKIQSVEKTILTFCQYLDWVPTRISALLFLMVGQFQPGFKTYIKLFNTPPQHNHQFLVSMAEQALQENSLDDIQVTKLEHLFAHACLLLLFIMAIFMIGRVI